MKFVGSILMGAALIGAPAAFAQDTPQTAPQDTPAPAPAPNAGPTAVSDAEVEQFVTAALAVQKVQSDTSIPETDRGTKMAEAVTTSGITPERFNAIGQAMQSDPALNKRIQDAAAARQSNSAPAASPEPSATPGQ